MFLTIDIGNTRTKAAIFDANGALLHDAIIDYDNAIDALNELIEKYNIQHAILSATGKLTWQPAALKINGRLIELAHDTPLPVKIIYSTPETLGRDRIAAACGAGFLFPEQNCLIIDAGTCITMDVLLKTGLYLGGNIAPGLVMRLRAMHEYTAKLPLEEIKWNDQPFGDSTSHALQNGACLGALMEIEGILSRARDSFGEVKVVVTGGDAAFLAEKIESQIFVEPELVVKGLFKILAFNV